jgi:hypothetical protein
MLSMPQSLARISSLGESRVGLASDKKCMSPASIKSDCLFTQSAFLICPLRSSRHPSPVRPSHLKCHGGATSTTDQSGYPPADSGSCGSISGALYVFASWVPGGIPNRKIVQQFCDIRCHLLSTPGPARPIHPYESPANRGCPLGTAHPKHLQTVADLLHDSADKMDDVRRVNSCILENFLFSLSEGSVVPELQWDQS